MTAEKITVFINGNPMQFPKEYNLGKVIAELGLDPGVIVAESNGKALGKEDFSETNLIEGQKIELIRFVGGG